MKLKGLCDSFPELLFKIYHPYSVSYARLLGGVFAPL